MSVLQVLVVVTLSSVKIIIVNNVCFQIRKNKNKNFLQTVNANIERQAMIHLYGFKVVNVSELAFCISPKTSFEKFVYVTIACFGYYYIFPPHFSFRIR